MDPGATLVNANGLRGTIRLAASELVELAAQARAVTASSEEDVKAADEFADRLPTLLGAQAPVEALMGRFERLPRKARDELAPQVAIACARLQHLASWLDFLDAWMERVPS
jgi:hypothetical protein